MKGYAWCWRACWYPLGLTGAVAGLVLAPVAGVVASMLMIGLLAGLAAVTFAHRDHGPGAGDVPEVSWWPALRAAGAAAGATGLLQAWAALLGPLVWPVLFLAAATSPWLIGHLVTWDRRARTGPTARRSSRTRPVRAGSAPCGCGCRAPVTAAEMAAVLGVLDDADLRCAWRVSLARLRGSTSLAARIEQVVVREAYLAEMERRHPDATRHWLGATPRPSTSPDPSYRGAEPSAADEVPPAA